METRTRLLVVNGYVPGIHLQGNGLEQRDNAGVVELSMPVDLRYARLGEFIEQHDPKKKESIENGVVV